MKNKFKYILLAIISFLVLLFFEKYTYKLFYVCNIKINNLKPIIQILLNLVIKISMCIIIFLLYRKDLKHSRRIKKNIFKNIFTVLIGLCSLLACSYLLNYVLSFLSSTLNINLINRTYYNIFIQKLDINLINYIVNTYIINPFLYCTVIILSINKLTKNRACSIIFSGLVAGVLYGLTLNGTILFLIINSIDVTVIYLILCYIYIKTNNMYITIITRILFLILIMILANYVGVLL